MAGLKKPTKKRNPENPNTALVLFLVFFVLLSIGLGVWGYYGYAGQEKLKAEAINKKKDADAARLGEEYALFMARDALVAVEGNGALDPDALNSWQGAQSQVLDDAGKFKVMDEKTKAALKKMLDANKAALGVKADDVNKKYEYQTTYKARLGALAEDVKRALTNFGKAENDLAEEKKRNDAIKAEYDASYKKLKKQIDVGNKAALAAAEQKTQEIEKALELNNKLNADLQQIGQKHGDEVTKLGNKIQELEAAFAKAKKAADLASQNFITRVNTEPHALLLDVSRGKPLWDEALGKIVKVDFQNREAVISVGSAIGVKPQMTFNVFAPGWKNQAEGPFKGTLELIRILGPNTSLVRITSIYDLNGTEIILNDPVKGRIQREADNPLKEGDLIFNMVFGTRVALAGVINWSGYPTDSPAEQLRNLKDFMYVLQRQGVQIDAYLDLTDGQVKGAITPKTRYFIAGDLLQPGPDGKLSDNAKKLNAAIGAIRSEAIGKGLFIISADNFANVIGFRRARSAGDLAASSPFRPGQPAAAIGDR